MFTHIYNGVNSVGAVGARPPHFIPGGATTCTAERSFSTLRRLKTFLRSTISMSQERLNHVTTGPKKLADRLDVHESWSDFVQRNNPRTHSFCDVNVNTKIDFDYSRISNFFYIAYTIFNYLRRAFVRASRRSLRLCLHVVMNTGGSGLARKLTSHRPISWKSLVLEPFFFCYCRVWIFQNCDRNRWCLGKYHFYLHTLLVKIDVLCLGVS